MIDTVVKINPIDKVKLMLIRISPQRTHQPDAVDDLTIFVLFIASSTDASFGPEQPHFPHANKNVVDFCKC